MNKLSQFIVDVSRQENDGSLQLFPFLRLDNYNSWALVCPEDQLIIVANS